MTSGVMLRTERLASRVPQIELAAEMGVGHSALAQLEKRDQVRDETAVRYRAALAMCVKREAVRQVDSAITILELTRDQLKVADV